MKRPIQISFFALSVLGANVFTACKSGNSDSNTSPKISADGRSVDLSFNLKPGNSYVYTSKVEQDINSMGMKTTNNIFAAYTYTVTASENNNVKLSVHYNKMNMEMNMNGETVKISSEDDNEQSAPFRMLIGKPFTMEISPKGNIMNIEGWEEIGKMANFKTEDIKQMMGSSFNFYPDKPVKVGESWTKDISSSMQMFKMDIKSTYTLKEIKGDVAILDSKATITMSPDATADPRMKDMKMEMKGDMTGEMQVDIPSGMAISGSLSQDIDGKMSMQGQEMPMSIKSKITLSGKQQ